MAELYNQSLNQYTTERVHMTPAPHCLEKQGHVWGLQAANLIGRDDVKFRNILSKYCENRWILKVSKRQFVFPSVQVYKSIEIKRRFQRL